MKFAIQKSNAVIGGVIGAAAIGLLIFILGLMGSGFFAFLGTVFGCLLAAAGGVLYWASTRSYLEVTDEHLINHMGPLPLRVTLDRVRTVEFVEGSNFAPSWSMERVQVMLYPHEIVEMSLPKDRTAFVLELKKRCPHAKIRYEIPVAEDAAGVEEQSL